MSAAHVFTHRKKLICKVVRVHGVLGKESERCPQDSESIQLLTFGECLANSIIKKKKCFDEGEVN